MKLAIKFAYDASILMNNIPDIINVVIENWCMQVMSFQVLQTQSTCTSHAAYGK